jgi:hypothetical protein
MYFLIKTLITALVIAGVSEIAKRWTPVAAILASLPLTSILAMIWLYHDTHDVAKITELSNGIFWAVLPSLLFFVVLPVLLKMGVKFGLAMVLASAIMFVGYTIYVMVLRKLGVNL